MRSCCYYYWFTHFGAYDFFTAKEEFFEGYFVKRKNQILTKLCSGMLYEQGFMDGWKNESSETVKENWGISISFKNDNYLVEEYMDGIAINFPA